MTFTASEAKNKFGQVLLQSQSGPVPIDKNGQVIAVVISAKLFDQYQEMQILLQDLLAREAAREKK